MTTANYTVNGMTCDHCVRAVTAAVRTLPGVTDVSVDLAGGTLSVIGEPQPSASTLEEAVRAAGYELNVSSNTEPTTQD